MSDPNPFISNGTCYRDTDDESPMRMLPCGNAALGHKPCCQAGDMCLDSNFCYNDDLDMTYRGGCSDSRFEDDSCFFLGDSAPPWQRVYFCAGSEELVIAYCGDEDTPETLDTDFECDCPSGRTAVDSVIADAVLLPVTAEGSVVWQPGHVPTSSSEPSSSTSGTGSLATVTVVNENEEGEDNNGEGNGGLSVGTKAGIGIGVSVAGLFILSVMFLLLKRRKRRTEVERVEPERAEAGIGERVCLLFGKIKGYAAGGEKKGLRDRGSLPPELPERPGTPPPAELAEDKGMSELEAPGVVATEQAPVWTGDRVSGMWEESGGIGSEQRDSIISALSR